MSKIANKTKISKTVVTNKGRSFAITTMGKTVAKC